MQLKYTCWHMFHMSPRPTSRLDYHLAVASLRADCDSVEVLSEDRDTDGENKEMWCAQSQGTDALDCNAHWTREGDRYSHRCQRNRQLRGLGNFFTWPGVRTQVPQVKTDHVSHLFNWETGLSNVSLAYIDMLILNNFSLLLYVQV